MLRPVFDLMTAAAQAKPGDRVIDVGCGCGATTIGFAARVRPQGEVLGLDVSEPMLARARERASQDLPVRFVHADATVFDFAPDWADLIVSRFGVMFFADPARSFANLRKGLKRGGRLAFACWREAKQNPFFIVPLREARKHAPPLPEIGPEEPGPFAFADETRVRRIPERSGLCRHRSDPAEPGSRHRRRPRARSGRRRRARDRTDEPHASGQSDAVCAAAASDIRAALAAHVRGDSVPLGAAIWVVIATNPPLSPRPSILRVRTPAW